MVPELTNMGKFDFFVGSTHKLTRVILFRKDTWLNVSQKVEKEIDFYDHSCHAGKLKKVKKKRRRDEELSSEESPRHHHNQTKVFAKFSQDTPPPGSKKKHLTIEQLNARRRKVWLSIVKKELPKVSLANGTRSVMTARKWKRKLS